MALSLTNMLGLSSSVHFTHIACYWKCLPFALHTSPLSVQALQGRSCLYYVSYATTTACIASNGRLLGEYWIGKDFGGSDRALIVVLSLHLKWLRNTTKSPSQDSLWAGRLPSQARPYYESGACYFKSKDNVIRCSVVVFALTDA
jgi:hypothetical protein